MPFRNQVFNKLVVQASNGQLIVIDPGNVNPQITFYSQDRSNIAFINAPNAGSPSRVALGMNSGLWTPGDAVPRRSRLYLDDLAQQLTLAVIRASDQERFGGFVLLDEAQAFYGYHTPGGAIDNWLKINSTNALINIPTGNFEVDTINGQKLIVNAGGLDLTGDALTFRGNAGTVNFINYGQFNFGTDNDLFNDGRVIPRGIMAAPASTAAAGTPTAVVGTEVRDAVLGNFVFTARATRRYRVVFSGAKMSGAAGSLCSFNIRDGGNATPTAASPLLATCAVTLDAAGGAGQVTLGTSATMFLTAGTHTLSVFTVCGVGGPAITPVNLRELYVEDMGV